MSRLDLRPTGRSRASYQPRYERSTGGRGRRRRGTGEITPAGRVIQLVAATLALAMLLDSHAMLRAGQAMRPGATRTAVLAVARPANRPATALSLDRPRRALDRLFGHDQAPTGPSELTALPPSADDEPPAPRAGARPSPAGRLAPRPAPPPLRRPTPAAPLKLLVTGDSMTEFLGPALINAANARDEVRGDTDVRYGTGLVRPDFFDWSINARRQMASRTPEAVVVMMGGNDGQDIVLADGRRLSPGSPDWTREYRRRAAVVMRVFADGGRRRVYWIGMPAARSDQLAVTYRQLDAALAEATKRVPGVRYVDIWPRLSDAGRYAPYLRDDGGQTVLARSRDGIHLTQDGARIAARLVLRPLDADWQVLR